MIHKYLFSVNFISNCSEDIKRQTFKFDVQFNESDLEFQDYNSDGNLATYKHRPHNYAWSVGFSQLKAKMKKMGLLKGRSQLGFHQDNGLARGYGRLGYPFANGINLDEFVLIECKEVKL